MNIHIFDFEVFKFDWIVVFRDPYTTGSYLAIHNDNYHLKEFLGAQGGVIGGFNNKHYDDWIIQAILNGGDNERIKDLSDFIIVKRQNGWEYPFLQYKKKTFYSFDLRDDIADEHMSDLSLGLKAIEGNLGLPIVESSVPFDLDRPLTKEELEEVIRYCKHDVDATCMLFKAREEYLTSKRIVAEMYGLKVEEALGLTNAKLSARVLGASRVDRTDERDYVVPDCLDQSLIPQVVLDFFLQIRDLSIPDTKLFGSGPGSKGMTLDVWVETSGGRCPVTYAWGGVHGAKPAYQTEATEDRLIVNYDVSSLYPNSMINFGYCSRSMEDPKAYEKLVKTRLAAKKAGDKDKATALKLAVNTVYGAMLNRFNDLADRRAGRSVCISNQLAMAQLIVMLARACSSIDFLNINTDGIMFLIDRAEDQRAAGIVAEWSRITGFEMERDDFVRLWQKDVNNYIGILAGGKMKTKGGFVSLYKGGNFKTNSEVVIHKAVVEYLVHGKPVEETIKECKNIFDFQRIEKTGGSYEGAYHYVNGNRVKVQKVNRIYAVKSLVYGRIVKGKLVTEKRKKDPQTGKMVAYAVNPVWQEPTISDCPPHAYIDNENTLTISSLDLNYYIDRAKTRVDKYINLDRKVANKLAKIKEVITIMAETTTPAIDWTKANVYQKLLEARRRFLASAPKKSGVNRYAEFKYFTLEDIIPVKTQIFTELGLVDTIFFKEDHATLVLCSTDEPGDLIEFQSTLAPDESLIKNPIQKLGAIQTYVRRYLYMLMLDIVEADVIDETAGKPEEDKPKKNNRPASPEKREEVKKDLIDEGGDATEVQIKSIKAGLKKLRAKEGEDNEPYVKATVNRIKAGLKKAEAEALLLEISEKVKG